MVEIEAKQNELGQFEIVNHERMKVASMKLKAESNQHTNQSPKTPQGRQVEVQANDLPSCRVRFFDR